MLFTDRMLLCQAVIILCVRLLHYSTRLLKHSNYQALTILSDRMLHCIYQDVTMPSQTMYSVESHIGTIHSAKPLH